MNGLQRGILTLVKSAITEETLPLPDDFAMEKAYPVIVDHRLMIMAYTGAIQCGIDKNLPVMQTLFQQYCHCLMRIEGQLHLVKQIFAAFDKNEIDYMPLKGCNINSLYPIPTLRLMGDADILIRMEQYEKIRPIMLKMGFTEGQENNHELVWHSKALRVELHKMMIPPHVEYHALFENSWERAQNVGGNRYALSHEEEFVFLFGHFTKHYRGGGIGCRHIIDFWVYRRAFPDMDETRIRQMLEQMHLTEFYDNIMHLVDVWFEGVETDEKTDFITEYIFQSGDWGNFESTMISLAAKRMDASGSGTRARMKTLWQSVFLPLKYMKNRYPVLQKAPWLLPVFWPVRWISALLFRHKNIIKNYKSVQIATPDKIENFQQAMAYVGLDFRN